MRRRRRTGRPRACKGNVGKPLPSRAGVAGVGPRPGVTPSFSEAHPSCWLSCRHTCPRRAGRVPRCRWGLLPEGLRPRPGAEPHATCTLRERGAHRQTRGQAPLGRGRGAVPRRSPDLHSWVGWALGAPPLPRPASFSCVGLSGGDTVPASRGCRPVSPQPPPPGRPPGPVAAWAHHWQPQARPQWPP